jgi:alanyl-tRNA synthetase
MQTDKLRSLYLDYFKAKDHKYYPSASLIPGDDPTLLFTGAGMNQFKANFMGLKKEPKRATSCQKCVRTADLVRVGETAYHHTFFEMLGNFSFGDYFKEEAIQYAWDFITRELRFNKDDLWVSVFHEDKEARDIWHKKIGVPDKRIVSMDAEDNFWPSNAPTLGPNGPCGPCSEIYVGKEPGKGVEIWNLVFTEFDRQDGGILKPLPQKNIDTGMGLERLASVIQGVESNFEIDIFRNIRAEIEAAGGAALFKNAKTKYRNAVLDHLRTIVFSISDGIAPSNEGRGYVVRKLIRKSALHLRDMGARQPTLYHFAPAIAAVMGRAYPELISNIATAQAVVKREEEAVWTILETRVPEAQIKIKSIALTTKPGQEAFSARRATETAFEYYDTYGVPKEILEEVLKQNQFALDEKHFTGLMEEQRERSRQGSKISGSIFAVNEDALTHAGLPATVFTGYERTEDAGKVLAIFVGDAQVKRIEKGQQGLLVTDRTPFYAESGGQVGDEGVVKGPSGEARVSDSQWNGEVVLHHIEVTGREIHVGDTVELQVDKVRRHAIMKNHSATHLLHSALRLVLGPHVKQRGSLVAPDRLRFDFAHFEGVKPEEMRRIEHLVNAEIRKDHAVVTELKDQKQAIADGAMAFFGDKYDSEVRVLTMGDFSKELCGGTHSPTTGFIGSLKIVSEGSVQSGVRRIEAVTGDAAARLAADEEQELKSILTYLDAERDGVRNSIIEAQEETKALERELKGAFTKVVRGSMTTLVDRSIEKKGTRLVLERLEGLDKDMLRDTADWVRTRPGSYAVVLSATLQEKPQIVVALSQDLVQKKMSAGELVKEISLKMGGSGGGRPDIAMGGGKPGSDLGEALHAARVLIEERLEKL